MCIRDRLYTKNAPVATTIASTTPITQFGAIFLLLSLLLLVLDLAGFFAGM